jgi:hypothetical protein
MEVISSYINRYRFSPKAEIIMLEKVAPVVRTTYINFYGLCEEAQKYVIDHNLVPVAIDFMKMRNFDDVDYLLEHGDAQMISNHIRANALKDDNQVRKLLEHNNSTLLMFMSVKVILLAKTLRMRLLTRKIIRLLRRWFIIFIVCLRQNLRKSLALVN